MDTPMNYALVGEDGVVFNIIWLCGENRSDFPNAICVSELAVEIGDQYFDGEFVRDGVVVPACEE